MNNTLFRRVAVLMGGVSVERDVSLRSGAAVANGLRQAGYDVAEVDVTERALNLPAGIDAVFIALHGEFGEDGRIQRLIQERGIPFTGAGPEASQLAFDKIRSKARLIQYGVPTPAYERLMPGGMRTLPLPVVVKPIRQGSSFGCHRVDRETDWPAAFADAVGYNGEALVETHIDGKELTVGIVGNEVLPVIEIRAPNNNYDYQAKYTRGMTEYVCPAPLPDAVTRVCQEWAQRTFKALDCRGMGRVDIRLSPENQPFVLELNTIPGFTETSLLPKAAHAAGYDFPRLCDTILRFASL